MMKKGSWVRVHQQVLAPGQRAPQVPEDTQSVPLELWLNGELMADAAPGDTVRVRTRSGREAEGTLLDAPTNYTHSFGDTVPELRQVGDMVVARLREVRHEG